MTGEKVKTTYFGLWSARKVERAFELLASLGVRYEIYEDEVSQVRLEAWCAWDAGAEHPNVGFHLWIYTADLPKLGTKIVDAFPERKFAARISD